MNVQLYPIAAICALGSIAPDFLADDDIRILAWEGPLSLATSTILVANGCWSIFIVFLGVSNFSFRCSKAIWIYCWKTLHSFVSCDVALCHLQYFICLSSSSDGILWYDFNLINPSDNYKSKILSALVMSNPYDSGSFFPKWTRHRLFTVLHPLSRCDHFLLLFRIIISRIFHIVDLFLKRLLGLVGSSLPCHPTSDLANTFKLLRCIFIFNVRQEPIKCCIGQLLIGQNQTVASVLDISESLDESSHRFIISVSSWSNRSTLTQ